MLIQLNAYSVNINLIHRTEEDENEMKNYNNQCLENEVTLIMGDFNAIVEREWENFN